MEGIQIFEKRVGFLEDIAYLKVVGYIDQMTSSVLVERFRKLKKEGVHQFVVDLGGVNYISSAGWGVFIGEIKEIRDNGGDIKLVNLTPEVFEVFEMLEFHRILHYYDSVEEAINEFDFLRGFDITKSQVKQLSEGASIAEESMPLEITTAPLRREGSGYQYSFTRLKVDPKLLPLPEKIKAVVIDNPLLNFWGIWKALRSEKYGRTKVGFIKLYSLLKQLNLDTKARRYRFYRSR